MSINKHGSGFQLDSMLFYKILCYDIMQSVNFATKVIDSVVTSMLQEIENINEPLSMLVWIDSGFHLTYQEL